MLPYILLAAYALIYILNRFVIKKRELRYLWIGIELVVIAIWSVYHGVRAFASFNVLFVLLTPVVAYLSYCISLVIVGTKCSKENLIPTGCFKLDPKLNKMFRRESADNLYYASLEELLYRWFIQNALYEISGSAIVSIVISAAIFFAIHLNKKIAIVQMIDIFVFSVIITLFFHWAVNPLYGIVIHIIRNQLIICQKYAFVQKENEKKAKYLRIVKARNIQ